MSNNPRKVLRWDSADEEHLLTLLSPSQLAWYEENRDRHNIPRPTKEELVERTRLFEEKMKIKYEALEKEYGLPYEEALIEQARQEKEALLFRQVEQEKKRQELIAEATKVVATATLGWLIEKGCNIHSKCFGEVRGYNSQQAAVFSIKVSLLSMSYKCGKMTIEECVSRLRNDINVMFKKTRR